MDVVFDFLVFKGFFEVNFEFVFGLLFGFSSQVDVKPEVGKLSCE